MIQAMLAELDCDEKKDDANIRLKQFLSSVLFVNCMTHEEIRVLTGLLTVYEESRQSGDESDTPQKAEELDEDIWADEESEDLRRKYCEKLLEEQRELDLRRILMYRNSRARALRRYLKELEQEKRRGNVPAKTQIIGR